MAEVKASAVVDKSKPREVNRVKETIVLVTKDAETGQTLSVQEVGPNIVTNAGDLYYAQRGAASVPTYTFNLGEFVVAYSYTRTVAVHGKTCTFGRFAGFVTYGYSGRKTFESGYPKTNDTDTDNTGKGTDVVTYKVIYGTSEANHVIKAIGVCRNGATTNSNGQLLSYKTLTAAQQVTKTSAITLTAYLNHTFNGV